MHSYVLDPELLLAFASNPRVTLVDADASACSQNSPPASIRKATKSGAIACTRCLRYCSRGLRDRSRKLLRGTSRERGSRHHSRIVSVRYAAGTPALTRPAAAVEWLVEQFKPTARLVLPGSLAAYQEGVHQAVSLPLEDLVRIFTGKPPAPRITRKTDPSNAALSPFNGEVASSSIASEPLPAMAGVQHNGGFACPRNVVAPGDQAPDHPDRA